MHFNTYEEYQEWKSQWKITYMELSERIRRRRHLLKHHLRQNSRRNVAQDRRELASLKEQARAMLTQHDEAKARMKRIREMRAQIAEQAKQFPLTLSAKVVDFSYNKGHNDYQILPRWILRCKGRTFYVNHLNAIGSISTKENDNPKNRGLLSFKNVSITIDTQGTANLIPLES